MRNHTCTLRGASRFLALLATPVIIFFASTAGLLAMANSIDREDNDDDDANNSDSNSDDCYNSANSDNSDNSDNSNLAEGERSHKMRRRKSAGDAPDNPLATERVCQARRQFLPSAERTVPSCRTMPEIISPDNLILRLSESDELFGHFTSSHHSDQGNSPFSLCGPHESAPSPPSQPRTGVAPSVPAIKPLKREIECCQNVMTSLLSRMDTLQRQLKETEGKVLQILRSCSAAAKAQPAELLAMLVALSQKLQGDYQSTETKYGDLTRELQELETRRCTAEAKLLELVHWCNPEGQNFHPMAVLADRHTEEDSTDLIKERQDELLQDSLPDMFHTHAGEDEGGYVTGNVLDGLSGDPSLLGISGERYSDVHPLYVKLLHAIGDRQMTEEELSELSLERDITLEDLQTKILRARRRRGDLFISENELESLKATLFHGPSSTVADLYASLLDKQEVVFLRQVDENMQAARTRLEQQRQCVRTLYEACHSIGAIPRDIPYSEKRAIFGRGSNAGGILDVDGDDDDMEVDPNDSDDDLVDATMAGIPPQGTMDPQGLESPYFPLLLSSPKHLLQERPMTAKAALEEALNEAHKTPTDGLSGHPDTPDYPNNLASRVSRASSASPVHVLQVQDRVKEYGISTMLMRFEEGNKVDFINRWLLQRLRITPLEVELLCSLFTMKLKVLNMMRWQADVLHFWALDDGNQSIVQPVSVSGSTSPASDPPGRCLGVEG